MNKFLLDRENYIFRQVSLLCENQGYTVDEAYGAIQQRLPKSWGKVIRDSQITTNGVSTNQSLNQLINSVDQKQFPIVVSQYAKLRSEYSEATSMVFSGAKSTSGYTVFLLVLAVSVYILFSRFVLPAFVEAHSEVSLGYGLPPFTEFMVNFGQHIFAFVLCFIFVIVFLQYYLSVHSAKKIASFQPLRESILMTNIIGPVKLVNKFIASIYVQILLCGSYDSAKSVELARSIIKKGDGSDIGNLEHWVCSANLGTLESEIPLQSRLIAQEMVLGLARHRQGVNLVMQCLLAIMVGHLIIAIYLPIFHLGEAL